MFKSGLIEWLLIKPPWQELLQPAAARVVEDGYRWVKQIVRPGVASAGKILATARTSRDSAQGAIRTAPQDDISNYSWTFRWRPGWRPALAAIG
jgi:hypothetical protein